MTIAEHIKTIQAGSSWIRKMFEEGARLKAEHGAENVYDFSLGNPNLEPPEEFQAALKDAVMSSAIGVHGYMANTGYPHVRKSVADYLCEEQQTKVTENEVIMTCGAAGALNVILKAILDPGDEVITPTPFFVEYSFYAGNHGGNLKTVMSKPDFSLDIDAVSAAITNKTKAVLINSPNNPTGQVYAKEELNELGTLLKEKGKNNMIELDGSLTNAEKIQTLQKKAKQLQFEINKIKSELNQTQLKVEEFNPIYEVYENDFKGF